ncbi:MAG TPA: iron chelate uptake ABC transporter family permease subunit, partial [Myxococcales bacterium]
MREPINLADFWALFGNSIVAALLAAVLCGYLGFFVVLRRLAFVSAALGQLAGLGVAFGFFLGSYFGLDPHAPTPIYLDPVVLALVMAGIVSAALGYVSRIERTTPESVVAFAYLASTAMAILLLASPRIVQEAHEVGDLLFGNAVAIRREHFVELAAVTLAVLASHAFLFKDLLFVSFDREMAQAVGLPVAKLDLLLHVSVGISVAVATRAIGALPVFGFLVLPAGAALLASDSVRGVLALSIGGAILAAGAGFYLSFVQSWPT